MATTKYCRKLYRRRVKNSKCRGRTCNKTTTCKYSSGSRRSFCRSKKNGRVCKLSLKKTSRRA